MNTQTLSCKALWIDGEDRPRCSGHNEPMVKNGFNRNGAQDWRCAERKRERQHEWHHKKYANDPEFVERWREQNRKYHTTVKGRLREHRRQAKRQMKKLEDRRNQRMLEDETDL